jgi:hypothetical protein
MLWFLLACTTTGPVIVAEPVAVEVQIAAPLGDPCGGAKNTCPDYGPMWGSVCPAGERCLRFKNNCAERVALSYQIGCNGDGSRGAPQCSCSSGPKLEPGDVATFSLTDGDYASCLPSWTPACLTAGLAVTANYDASVETEHDEEQRSCSGTRIEFTAGNSADPYGRFDSYDIDVEKGYAVPVSFAPELTCAHDHQNHDCRPLVCTSGKCPDAYATPTTGGCPDGRSPQPGCQDTFSGAEGYLVELCPSPVPPSCQDAVACP